MGPVNTRRSIDVGSRPAARHASSKRSICPRTTRTPASTSSRTPRDRDHRSSPRPGSIGRGEPHPTVTGGGHGEGDRGVLHTAGIGPGLDRCIEPSRRTTSRARASRRSSTSRNSANRSARSDGDQGSWPEHHRVPAVAARADAKGQPTARESSSVTSSRANGTG